MEIASIVMPNFDVNEPKAEITGIKAVNKQEVKKGQMIFLAETSKAVNEIYADVSGYILLLCKKYEEKKTGEKLAVIFSSIEDLEKYEEEIKAASAVQPVEDTEINATKKAAEMADKLQIDLKEVSALKGGGVIRTKDVQKFLEQKKASGAGDAVRPKHIFHFDRERVVIIGAGYGAEVVIDILLDDYDKEVAGLVDDHVKKLENYEYEIFRCGIWDFTDKIDKDSYDTVLISLGSSLSTMELRKKIFDNYREQGIEFTNAIAKSVEIRRGVSIGVGNIIGAGSYIGTMTQIGDNNSIGYGISIGHHNIIGNHNLIAPGVAISGLVTIGSSCIMPAGVTVINGVSIGDRVVLPLGHAVTYSLEEGTVIRQKIMS